MPTWKHGYRSISGASNGQLPQNDDPVALTIHGMTYTQQPGTALLVRAFLAAINVGLIMQQGISPSVTKAVELKVPSEDFIREVNGKAKTALEAGRLLEVLRGEPAPGAGSP